MFGYQTNGTIFFNFFIDIKSRCEQENTFKPSASVISVPYPIDLCREVCYFCLFLEYPQRFSCLIFNGNVFFGKKWEKTQE